MAEHNDLGKFGEELAVDFLEKNGYEILETNWTFDKAEIDIIAQKNGILAVVEVKTRSSIEFGLPQDFVKPKKIQLFVKAINEYVTQNDLDVEVRFDIVAKNKKKTEFVIEHIEEAFDHKNLNEDVPEFKDLNPTAEHIAYIIWHKLRVLIAADKELEITLYETPRNFVTYKGL